MSLRAIIGNGAIYLIGDLLSRAMPFLLMPYLTKRLGVEGFGELSLFQTIVVFLTVGFCFCQEGAISRYYFRYGVRNINAVIFSGFVVSTIMLFIAAAIGVFFNNFFFVFLCFCAYSQVFINVQLTLRQLKNKSLHYIFIQFFSAFFSIILTIFLFEYLSFKPVYRLMAVFVANLLLITLIMVVNADKMLSVSLLRKIFLNVKFVFLIGLPLSLHQFGMLIKGQLDRFVVYDKMSVSDLGQYSAAYQLSSLFLIIFMAVNKAVVPFFYNFILGSGNVNYRLIMRCFFFSVIVAFFPVLIVSFIPNNLFLFIVGKDFVDVKFYTVLFSLGVGFHIPYLFLVNCLFCMNRNLSVTFSTCFSVLFYCVSLYLFSCFFSKFLPLALFSSNVINIILLLFFCMKRDL